MSNKKITDLTELTTPTTDDVFPVVDIATNTTQKVQLGNLPTTPAVTSALASKQATLVSGTNIKTVNGTSVLGSGDINIPLTPPSGVSGAIQFSTGSAFASDAANFFWDDTNNRLGIGTNAPTEVLDLVRSSGQGAIRFFNTAHSINTIQSGSTFRIFNSTAGTPAASVGFFQNINNQIGINTNNLTASLNVQGSGTTSATTSLLVQNSGGTDNLTLRDNGSLTVRLVVNSNGFSANSTGYLQIAGRFNITSPSDGTVTFLNTAETDFNRLQFGGTTSSYPSLKRNGTAIDVRLADDSNYAGFNTGATFIKGSGSTSATTSLLVQNSAGTQLFAVRDDGVALMSRINHGSSDSEGQLRMVSSALIYNSQGSASLSSISAAFEVQSTNRGFLPPRMTTTEKNAISSPASGLVVYDSTTNKLCCYNGSTWNDLF